jgi:dihydroxyacetone kinase-like predicted kinase
MTVQNMQKEKRGASPERTVEKYLVTDSDSECDFAIVAVASTERLQHLFADMGADVVILSDIAPSSQDFLEAFSRVNAKEILVFPNSSNSILSSMQAGGMYKNARVTVMNCRSAAECYAALSLIDFDADAGSAISTAKDAISQVYEVALYHASRDVSFGSRDIRKNDFFALSDKKILGVGESLETVALDAVRNTVGSSDYSALTVFYGGGIAEEYTEHIVGLIGEAAPELEVAALSTEDPAYSLLLLFE